MAYTRDVRQALVDDEPLESIDVNYTPALLARTAWETAQVTRALHFIDYDKVARIGRIYEVQELYEEAESSVVRTLADIGQLNWDEPVDAVDVILPVLVRVDNFGDMLIEVYSNAEANDFEISEPVTTDDEQSSP